MNGRELVLEFVRRRDLHFPKSPYVPMYGRDAKILLSIVEVLGEPETLLRMEAYFEDRDDWLQATAWGIPMFKSKINQYDKLIASQARALAESKRARANMNETPGKDRTGTSEPKEFGDLIKQFINKVE